MPRMCPQLSTILCNNGKMCYNGGKCGSYESLPFKPCICLSGYEGTYCEVDLYPLGVRVSRWNERLSPPVSFCLLIFVIVCFAVPTNGRAIVMNRFQTVMYIISISRAPLMPDPNKTLKLYYIDL
jgi:hypothetical protein